MTSITAHGMTYPTIAIAQERITDLQRENHRWGDSDGRVTEINAITAAIAAADADRVAKGYVAVTDGDDVWTVVRDEYGMECEHPACAVLHRHLSTVPFADGKAHDVWVEHNGRERQVRMARWHEVMRVDWVILFNGARVGDAHDTKREAMEQARRMPRI